MLSLWTGKKATSVQFPDTHFIIMPVDRSQLGPLYLTQTWKMLRHTSVDVLGCVMKTKVFLGFATIGHLYFLCRREGQGEKNLMVQKYLKVSY